MKKPVFKLLSAALVILLLICVVSPVGAKTATRDVLADKLYAFWHQEAYGGLSNGEAVYDHEWIEDVFYYDFGAVPPTYDGGWQTHLVETFDGYSYFLSFTHTFVFCGTTEPDENGNVISFEGLDTITPDLYGQLDLTDTSLQSLSGPQAGQTHITGVFLDRCPSLGSAEFSGQEYCTVFSALECPELNGVELKDGVFEHIDLSLKDWEKDIHVSAFGPGTVGMKHAHNGVSVQFYAYDPEGCFMGWFKDGEFFTAAKNFSMNEGGRYVACFGGDTDGDRLITIQDALCVLRSAMGLRALPDGCFADMTGDGEVTIADALLLLRFALGLWN